MNGADKPKKRIVVCCDGTWMDSEGISQTPSNVTLISRAIEPYGIDENGNRIPQIVFYENGVGTGSNNFYTKYIGGATGEGLAEHIRTAYGFIANNYCDGDEIFLFGFSRGAFTARSISSIINDIGLLTERGMNDFIQIFEDWEFVNKENWKTRFPTRPWHNHKPPVTSPHYQDHLITKGLTRPHIPIKAVGVWDTVGSLGIPMIGLLPQPPSHDFSFVDTKVASNIEYAFQALALDERRRSFSPTIWEKPADQEFPKVLKQVWFPGAHSDVGGAYDEADLSNITLCWMVSQLDGLLSFKKKYLNELIESNIESQKSRRDLRPWGAGTIHNSLTWFYTLGGSITRTPKQYTATPPYSQHGTIGWIFIHTLHSIGTALHLYKPKLRRLLENTNETVHASVRIRMSENNTAIGSHGKYDSSALKGWVFHGTETQPDTPIAVGAPGEAGEMTNVVWTTSYQNPRNSREETLEMKEEPLHEFERYILRLWPEIRDRFGKIRPGNHRQEITKAYAHHHVNVKEVPVIAPGHAAAKQQNGTTR